MTKPVKTSPAHDMRAALSEIAMTVKAVNVSGKPMFWSRTASADVLRTYRDACVEFSNVGWYGDKGRWIAAFPVWQRSLSRKSYEGIEFRPVPPCIADCSRANFVNSWRGWSVQPQQGGRYEKLIELIRHGMCQESESLFDWYWAYLADSVQNPARLPGTAIVMYGSQGVGKNTVFDAAASLCRDHSIEVTTEEQLTGRFTSHLCNQLYVLSDEATYSRSRAALGRLKALITSPTLAVEEKGKPIYMTRNCTRLFIATNNDEAFPAAIGERRAAVFKFSDVYKDDREFFGQLRSELENGGRESLFYDLLHADLSALPNPAVIPKTQALVEQQVLALDSVTSFALDALESGQLVSEAEHKYDSMWPEHVAISDLWRGYLLHTKEGKYRYQVSSSRTLLKQLAPLLGLSTESRTKWMRDSAGENRKPKTRQIPALEDAAAAFEEATGIAPNISASDCGESAPPAEYEADEVVIPVDFSALHKSTGKTGTNHG